MTTRRSALALVTGALIAPSALACSIARDRGGLRQQVIRAYRSASVVVLAKVVGTRFQDPPTSPFGEAPAHRAWLKVVENWKGRHEPGSSLETIAPTSIGTCGVVLTPDETYLLYLRGKGPYDLTLSNRNAKLGDASQDIEILRRRFGKVSRDA